MNYRNLTAEEVAQLKALGNRAEDWNNIHVADGFDAAFVSTTCFGGHVYLGACGDGLVRDGDLALPEGISGSMLRDSCVGNHCAIHNVHMLSGYSIGDHSVLFNIDEMTATVGEEDYAWLEPMNENGGRRILPFAGMTVGDAYLWARFRGRPQLMERLEQLTRSELKTLKGGYGQVGSLCVVKNT